jgi:hypothetical protein
MAQRVYRNLSGFEAALVRFSKSAQSTQERALRRSVQRVDDALDRAAVRIGGSDRRISGVGRNGAGVGHDTIRSAETQFTKRVLFRKTGPWQLRDNTMSSGPTAVRILTPNLRRSPRPIDPAKKFMPSLRTRDGQFYSNFSRSPSGPFIKVNAGVGPRSPHWRNAIQSVQPRVIELHQQAFDEAGYDAFG